MKLRAQKVFVYMKDGERTQAEVGDLIRVGNLSEALQLINAGFAVADLMPLMPENAQKIAKKGSKDEKIEQ